MTKVAVVLHMYLFHSIPFATHTLFMYIFACLRGIWTNFTQLTCSDIVLVWVSSCSSVEHDACVKHAFPFSLSTTFSPVFLYMLLSLSLSNFGLLFLSHFPSLFPLIFLQIPFLFPVFPRTGFVASSAGWVLFRCQIKTHGKSAILSQWWNKSRTLRVIWRRMTQIPPLALEQTRGLQLKGCYVAGVHGLFGFCSHTRGLQPSLPSLLLSVLRAAVLSLLLCLDFRVN